MPPPYWPESKRKRAGRLATFLREGMQTRVNRDGKIEHFWEGSVEVDIAFADLSACASERHRRDLCSSVLMRALKHIDVGSPLEKLEQAVRDVLSHDRARERDEACRWRFLLPLHVRMDSSLALPIRLRVFARVFSVVNREEANRVAKGKIDDEDALQEVTHLWAAHKVDVPDHYLTVLSTHRDFDRAWDLLQPAFDTLRGGLEFAANARKWTLFASEAPRRSLPHPQWMLARRGATVEGNHFVYNESATLRPLALASALLERTRQLLKPLRAEPRAGTVASLLGDCFRLYAQAMDARYDWARLLAFWQLAERLTLAQDSRGKTTDVERRLLRFQPRFREPVIDLRELVAVAGERRNKLVHEARHQDVSEMDVNVLKLLCVEGMLFLIRNRKRIPSESHLREFFARVTASDQALKVSRHVDRHLIALRRQLRR